MSIVTIRPTHFVRKEREATKIFRLWYPRPKAKDSRTPKIRKRIEALLDCGYSMQELREWFGFDNPRANTNTPEANNIWGDIKAIYKQSCAYCGKHTLHLVKDHIIPVSRGGKDTMDNIVPACSHCNRSKNDKKLFDWQKFRHLQMHLLGI